MYVTIPLQSKKYSTTDNASSLVKSLNSSQIDSNSSPNLGFVVTIDDRHSDARLPAAINHQFHFFPWKAPGYTFTTFHA
jgi:hypothetical protein